MKTKFIYLIHFDPPYKRARHYLGSTNNVKARIEEHKAGHGAKLTSAAAEAGCNFNIVRIMDGDKQEERRLKNRKNGPDLCPICNPGLKLSDREKRRLKKLKNNTCNTKTIKEGEQE